MAKAKLPTVTLGADPEFMLYSMEKRRMVSAIGVLKNDKYTPIDLGEGDKMYADNVLVEFSFPPVDSVEDFIRTLGGVLKKGQAKLGDKYRLVAKAAHIYDEEELKDPKAREGGCSPNFNVYTQKANLPPAFKDGLRTGSFHIHIGSPELESKEMKDQMIRLLDCYLGIPSILFDSDNTAPQRRALYGRAGEFRPTPYGVEYRVLGPFALRHPNLVRLVLGLAYKAIAALRSGARVGWDDTSIQTVINDHQTANARALIVGNIGGSMLDDIIAPWVPDLYRDWNIFDQKPTPKTDVEFGREFDRAFKELITKPIHDDEEENA